MYYQLQYDFLQSILSKMNLPYHEISLEDMAVKDLDYGIRELLGIKDIYVKAYQNLFSVAENCSIYKVVDEFHCHYLFFRLPLTTPSRGLLIGPYLSLAMTQQETLEIGERYHITPDILSKLTSCLNILPILQEENNLFAIVTSFTEILWGKDSVQTIDMIGPTIPQQPINAAGKLSSVKDTHAFMQTLEKRYAYENELLYMVSQGQYQRVKSFVYYFKNISLDQRSSNPLRELKNYGIICNTLLRKASEQGGVHPIYLNRISSHFAKKIEALNSLKGGENLLDEMIREYCRMVRNHSTKHYSPPVQRTLAYIEANLAGTLNLHTLAEAENLSEGYLSTLFRKETSKTITQYILEHRMKNAARLLQTTTLQIQTIAHYCGIQDVNYFTKQFKKHYSMTPTQFRKEKTPYHPS